MSQTITRRRFVALAGAAATTLGLSRAAYGQDARPKVVVIGGGAGGAISARRLAEDSGGGIDVALVEPKALYTTCFFSNHVIGGLLGFDAITHGYDGLASLGVRHVRQTASAIDPETRSVTLADGATLLYDRLVVAPGIDFIWDSIEGYGEGLQETFPHAWQGGEQTRLLKAQIEAMRDGGTIVLVAPPSPYRCPPAPYERASMIAHALKSAKPKSKVIILDPKANFSKQDLFIDGWGRHYGAMIEWLPPEFTGGPKRLHADTREIETGDGTRFKGDVINLVPAQKAGAIAFQAGLANETGWCPVDPGTMESTLRPGIHVIGDAAAAGDMPKSGYAAGSQARLAAAAIRIALLGDKAPLPALSNSCWSIIAPGDTVKIGAAYRPKDGKIAATAPFVSSVDEPASLREKTSAESYAWYRTMTEEMFGR